jgi:hypothetical protein
LDSRDQAILELHSKNVYPGLVILLVPYCCFRPGFWIVAHRYNLLIA